MSGDLYSARSPAGFDACDNAVESPSPAALPAFPTQHTRIVVDASRAREFLHQMEELFSCHREIGDKFAQAPSQPLKFLRDMAMETFRNAGLSGKAASQGAHPPRSFSPNRCVYAGEELRHRNTKDFRTGKSSAVGGLAMKSFELT